MNPKLIKNPLSLVRGTAATLVQKTITENGTYNAQTDAADGYSSVTVKIGPTTRDVSNETEFASALLASDDGDIVNVIHDFNVYSSYNITKSVTITSSNRSLITVGVDNFLNVGDSQRNGNLVITGSLFIGYSGQGTIVRMVKGTLTLQGSAKLMSSWTTIRMASDGGMAGNCYVYIKDDAGVLANSTNQDDNVIYVNDGSRAHLYIEGGTVSRMYGPVGSGPVGSYGRGISMPAGHIYISGGIISAYYPIYLWYGAGSATKSVTISGGLVDGDITGIFYQNNCKRASVSITGGIVRGKYSAISMRAPTDMTGNIVTISGGTVEATGDETGNTNAVTLGACNFEVHGGEVLGADYGIEVTGNLLASFYVYSPSYIYGRVSAIRGTGSATAYIHGGTVSGGTSDISSGVSYSILDGCAQIGNTYYTSIKSAIAAASAGDVITVLENTQIPQGVTITK